MQTVARVGLRCTMIPVWAFVFSKGYVYTIQKEIAKGPQVSRKTLPRLVNSVLQEEPCAGFHVCWA